jgi:peptide deformylase
MTQPSPVVLFPDHALTVAAEPRAVDAPLREAGAALLATAESLRAYGLAGAHIGRVEPVVVVSLGPVEGRDYRLWYNPEVIDAMGAPEAGSEGSVSLPGIEVDIMRSPRVRVGFDDADGVRQELALEGFAARVAQHEIEQMNGVFFLDRLSRLKREAALRRYRKLNR